MIPRPRRHRHGFYEKGKTRIYYEEHGSGFPLMLIAGRRAQLESLLLHRSAPFNAIDEFKGEYRVIAAGSPQRERRPVHRPARHRADVGAYTDDHIGLMDHLASSASW